MSVLLSELESCSKLRQNICDIRAHCSIKISNLSLVTADPDGRALQGIGLRPLACWECGLESRRMHECLYVVSVVCCEISATDRSLARRSPTECGVAECDL
jgi:hypothetical protein